jgi:hypothetical protein
MPVANPIPHISDHVCEDMQDEFAASQNFNQKKQPKQLNKSHRSINFLFSKTIKQFKQTISKDNNMKDSHEDNSVSRDVSMKEIHHDEGVSRSSYPRNNLLS